MDEAAARKILDDWIQGDNGLYCPGRWVDWRVGANSIALDAEFDLEELEALVWWMKNKGKS